MRLRTVNNPYLPSSDSRNDEDKGEGDHSEGYHQTDLQQVLCNGGFVIRVERWPRLLTERISHFG